MQFKAVKLILIFTASIFAFGLAEHRVQGYASGSPPGASGAPNETNCTVCHSSFALNSSSGSIAITGLPTTYNVNQQIPITVTVAYSGRSHFGFQLTALTDNGAQAGVINITDSGRTQAFGDYVGSAYRVYVDQTTSGSSSSNGQAQWTFTWVAPATSTGKVTFYASGVAANNNGNIDGDYVYTTTASILAVPPPTAIATVSAASYQPNIISAESIASGFGSNLTTGTGQAVSLPLPTTLAGAVVYIRDSGNSQRIMPLFYASPTQVNYLVPIGTATGPATISVLNGATTVATGTVQVASVAPGLFSADASGQGLAAATVLRIAADGTQTYEPVAIYDQAQGKFIATPINLGVDSDQVFLLLFGTGIRGRSSLSAVTALAGGTDAEVLYAGLQGSFVGLDQVNLRLPRTLLGRGNIDVQLTVDGVTANVIRIQVK